MITLLIAIGSFILYIVAYNTYGKFLGKKIFQLDAKNEVPSITQRDGIDYVPTKRNIIFGHHFTSIAGTGPIVGPALAVIWGWLPALLWVIFGSILIGAVHDFGSLIISIRNRGQTVGDVAGRVLAPRARLLFLSILFMALTIVLAIFGLVIASVFRMYPSAIFPCIIQIPIAITIGVLINKRGSNMLLPCILALLAMYLSVYFGNSGLLNSFNLLLSEWSIITWVIVLLIYCYIASVLPVWTLLQPRDFINSLQLLSSIGLVMLGLIVAGIFGGQPTTSDARTSLEIIAPVARVGQNSPEGAPWIIPFLFITIACGAISGFHCLVSSGTTSKQISSEKDAQFIGFGSMLTEGFLAVLVILACVAGLGLGTEFNGKTLVGQDAYMARYESWGGAKGLGAKIGAFVDGAANFLKSLGLSSEFAIALMGVFVASFAATTLDTACRLQRYVIQELASTMGTKKNPFKFFQNKHAATILAVVLAFSVAATPAPGADWSIQNTGKGGLNLWPLFGATNQLLAGLAFLVILFWMRRRKISLWFIFIPAVFMLLLPGMAMSIELFKDKGWIDKKNYLLVTFGIATLALELWMIIEAIIAWPKVKGLMEEPIPDIIVNSDAENEGGRSC
ncbi:MAG: carbon starvation protein A [Verrucomicrobiota bacterium]|nr:carbon starvation protein A [Verrucomicrobiota bacterium]